MLGFDDQKRNGNVLQRENESTRDRTHVDVFQSILFQFAQRFLIHVFLIVSFVDVVAPCTVTSI